MLYKPRTSRGLHEAQSPALGVSMRIIHQFRKREQRGELEPKCVLEPRFLGSFLWPIYPLSLVPEVFPIVNSIQSPRFLSGEFLCGRTLVCKLKTLLFYIVVDFH